MANIRSAPRTGNKQIDYALEKVYDDLRRVANESSPAPAETPSRPVVQSTSTTVVRENPYDDSGLSSQIDEITTRINTYIIDDTYTGTQLDDRITANKNSIATLSSGSGYDDTELRGKIETNKNNIEDNDSDIATLRTDVNSNDTDITNLGTRIDNLNIPSAYNDAEVRRLIGANTSNISSNDDDITALGTRIDNLSIPTLNQEHADFDWTWTEQFNSTTNKTDVTLQLYAKGNTQSIITAEGIVPSTWGSLSNQNKFRTLSVNEFTHGTKESHTISVNQGDDWSFLVLVTHEAASALGRRDFRYQANDPYYFYIKGNDLIAPIKLQGTTNPSITGYDDSGVKADILENQGYIIELEKTAPFYVHLEYIPNNMAGLTSFATQITTLLPSHYAYIFDVQWGIANNRFTKREIYVTDSTTVTYFVNNPAISNPRNTAYDFKQAERISVTVYGTEDDVTGGRYTKSAFDALGYTTVRIKAITDYVPIHPKLISDVSGLGTRIDNLNIPTLGREHADFDWIWWEAWETQNDYPMTNVTLNLIAKGNAKSIISAESIIPNTWADLSNQEKYNTISINEFTEGTRQTQNFRLQRGQKWKHLVLVTDKAWDDFSLSDFRWSDNSPYFYLIEGSDLIAPVLLEATTRNNFALNLNISCKYLWDSTAKKWRALIVAQTQGNSFGTKYRLLAWKGNEGQSSFTYGNVDMEINSNTRLIEGATNDMTGLDPNEVWFIGIFYERVAGARGTTKPTSAEVKTTKRFIYKEVQQAPANQPGIASDIEDIKKKAVILYP